MWKSWLFEHFEVVQHGEYIHTIFHLEWHPSSHISRDELHQVHYSNMIGINFWKMLVVTNKVIKFYLDLFMLDMPKNMKVKMVGTFSSVTCLLENCGPIEWREWISAIRGIRECNHVVIVNQYISWWQIIILAWIYKGCLHLGIKFLARS